MNTWKTTRLLHTENSDALSRRTLLRAVGAALSLPFLESFVPRAANAANRKTDSKLKLAYLYFPNGVAEGTWQPEEVAEDGRILKLNKWMSPLESLKENLIIPKNVWTPRGNGHGAGTATWLTGGRYDGKRIDAGGISVDQLAARHIGGETPLPTLQLSLEGEGYFSNNLPRNTISWTKTGTPTSRETSPRMVYDRMFRRADEGMADRSVLDLVSQEARRLKRRVNAHDRRKVDEYLESVRAVEKRIEFAERQARKADAEAFPYAIRRPELGIPTDHGEYMRTMMDLMVMAFWSGATRICTFMLDHGQSNRYFKFVNGVQGTWHALSHYKDISGKTEDDDGKTSWASRTSKRDMYSAVNKWHHEQVAYLLNRMKQVEDDGASLLDNAMIVYGSSLSDGHEHGEEDLPLIIAGGGAGAIKPGRALQYEDNTSMSNLHLFALHHLGTPVEKFGESTEMMTELKG